MSYLVDTNVISEFSRPIPSRAVTEWFENVADDALHMSILTVGELRRGVEQLPAGKRRERLRYWLEQELPSWFGPRLLPIDAAVADRWGRLLASVPRTLPAVDSLIAATALHHQLRIVTRNTEDFAIDGLETVDPWNVGG